MPISNWYEYPANYSNGTAVEGVGTFVKYAQYVSGDWLGNGLILLIWLMTFGLSMVAGARKALMVSSFITFLFSIYLMRLDLIHPVVMVTLIILTVIGAIGSSQEQGL